ncbi:hypothetical protein M422DRAFT_784917 [Sphaerobolus stellatus SS14]|uniref:ABC1 atypical kinase-like domain-containing protein n=1 Tax=Sphaerobolus stellatus (strain SS14) TaxID=990650 RepID=A0A0C9UPJ8_SPHS4|nr:hypothetical protein M422DRAFT_784917 [Sphaerobolus stellatus SS14]
MLPRFRLSHLPTGLQRHIFQSCFESIPYLRRPTGFYQFKPRFYSQRANFGAPRWRISRRLLFGVPAVGLLAIYFVPKPKNANQIFFSSPAVIPCSEEPCPDAPLQLIHSPYEEQPFLTKITRFIQTYILDPLLTTRRFIYLCYLFIPVLVTSPMILIGVPGSGAPRRRRISNENDRPGKKRRLRFDDKDGERWGAVWWYDFLVRQMVKAGPTFIKLAQWAASRADIFPDALCEKMGRLHSGGKPHSMQHTKRIIESVFRRPFSEVFEEFDEEPIGTGAIAQVYRAKLRPDLLPPAYLDPKRPSLSWRKNKKIPAIIPPDPPPAVPTADVAVKIQHPHVAHMIQRDLRIISFFAHCISLFPGMEWISLPEEVYVFGRMMNEQLNLRNEVNNLKKFEEHFSSRMAAVTFPRPLEDYSTKDILIEEYENALPLKAFLQNGGGPFDDAIAESGLDAFLKMLLLDNFVHADLHPGNIMIKFYKPSTGFVLRNIAASIFNKELTTEFTATQHAEQDAVIDRLRPLIHHPEAWRASLGRLWKEGYQPELVFIDAGLITTLDSHDRRNFLDLFRAIAEFDGYRAGKLMVERCRTPELTVDPETFALKIQHLVLNVKAKTFSLAKIKISDVLTDVLKAVRQHHVKMEADFINTVISVLLLEGIGRQLDPNLDLFKSSLPILRQLGRQMTTQETMSQLKDSNIGAMLKIWVWLEARELISSAIVNLDDMVKFDLLTPNI